MALVREVADRVVVMYGDVLLKKERYRVIGSPKHPYTKSLLQAIPNMDVSEKLRAIEGTTPSIETLNSFGCPFVNRCPVAIKNVFIVSQREQRILRALLADVLEHNKAKSKEKVNAS